MTRSFFSLRLTASCLALCAFAVWPNLSAAQNYIHRHAFSGPNVVVDFATLDQGSQTSSSPYGAAPVYQESLPFPPVATAPSPMVAPRLTPPSSQEARPLIAPTPLPASPNAMAIPGHYVADADAPSRNIPAPSEFHARDMVAVPPVASTIQPETRAASRHGTSGQAAFNAESGNIRTRAMLSNARTATNNKHGRVNLATISSAPAAPRAAAPIQNYDASTRAATPSLAAPSSAKHDIIPMPPQADLDTLDEELPPITTASVARDTGNIPSSALPMPDDAPHATTPDPKSFTLNFAKESGDLDKEAKTQLDKIIAALRDDPSLRAQVRAYASGSAENSGQARRLSLTRALAARTYVLDHNIPATRLDIRALGNNKTDNGQTADKVEITLIK